MALNWDHADEDRGARRVVALKDPRPVATVSIFSLRHSRIKKRSYYRLKLRVWTKCINAFVDVLDQTRMLDGSDGPRGYLESGGLRLLL